MARRHTPLLSPPLWDLGHTAAHEELWLVRRLSGSLAAPGARGRLYRDRDAARARWRKFTRATVAAMYAAAGLRLLEWHEDPRGWSAVSLARHA